MEGLSVPPHETFAYSTSKAALHHLSRNLAGRLGWEGITSNTIACGPFATKSTPSLIPPPTTCHLCHPSIVMAHTLKHQGDEIISSIPLNRIGVDEDVAGTAIFLSSQAGKYVNGATIALDGGSIVNMPRLTHFPVPEKAKL